VSTGCSMHVEIQDLTIDCTVEIETTAVTSSHSLS